MALVTVQRAPSPRRNQEQDEVTRIYLSYPAFPKNKAIKVCCQSIFSTAEVGFYLMPGGYFVTFVS